MLKREFELRIVVSLGIVAAVCAASALISPHTPPTMALIGSTAGWSRKDSLMAGFLLLAVVMVLASVVRMWAGTELTAPRVMAFRVQADELHTAGPYRVVRNPIYLADLTAICAISLGLPPPGLLMPVLFLLHYRRLIAYEEISLAPGFRDEFTAYAAATPRLFPSFSSLRRIPEAFREFRLTGEGVRHNGLYLLFIPGFIAAAWTGDFLVAAGIGLPSVADWAIVHTKLGRRQ
jgi:protein-S-isoprenylcysteine O-methyltransferase Ste14